MGNTEERAAVPDSITVRGRTVTGFSELAPAAGIRMQRAIRDAAHECGCTAGATVAAAALCVYLIIRGVLPWLAGGPIALTWAGGALVTISAAVAGKLFGLYVADRRLESSLQKFEAARARAIAERSTV